MRYKHYVSIQEFAEFLQFEIFVHTCINPAIIMTSCEHTQSSAYEEDLRWCIVWQKEGLGCSNEMIAANLNIIFVITHMCASTPKSAQQEVRKSL